MKIKIRIYPIPELYNLFLAVINYQNDEVCAQKEAEELLTKKLKGKIKKRFGRNTIVQSRIFSPFSEKLLLKIIMADNFK